MLPAHPKPRPSVPDDAKPILANVEVPGQVALPDASWSRPDYSQRYGTHDKLLLPPVDTQFIQTVLWRKLTVGVRLANWQPHDTACPICGQQETTQHLVAGCKYISVAAHVAAQCLGPADTEEGPVTDPTVILWDNPELSLTTPLGIAMWSIVRAAWAQRCLHKFNRRLPPPTWDQLLTSWITVLGEWEEHPTPTLPKDEVQHPAVGGVGVQCVGFGDHRDMAEYIPVGEEQTNNRGELRAALRSLQGHRVGQRSLICLDSLLVVNGVFGWAQRWC